MDLPHNYRDQALLSRKLFIHIADIRMNKSHLSSGACEFAVTFDLQTPDLRSVKETM